MLLVRVALVGQIVWTKNESNLGLPIVFSIVQVVSLMFVPESPKYLLLKKDNIEQAEKGLK